MDNEMEKRHISVEEFETLKQNYELLKLKSERETQAFADLSKSLYDLSCQVIDTGKSRPMKMGALFRNLRHHPFRTLKDMVKLALFKRDLPISPLADIEQTIYRMHLQIEGTRGDRSEIKNALVKRLRKGEYRGVWIIGSLVMGWYETFKQRHHHLADNLMAQGYLVFCAMNPDFPRDITDYVRREQENLYLVNFNDREKRQDILNTLILNSKKPVYYSLMPTEPGTTIDDIKFLQSSGVTIYYDYFDELCADIFPGVTPQHFERHDYLLQNPDVLVCSTAENLYRKAAKYRSGRVILSKNGVRPEDWILPENSKIPPEMEPVLARKGKIIGFYGSFAPWLNYDMLVTLAKERPDYSIVMIGYDYEWGKGAFAKSGLANYPNVFIIPAQRYENLKYFSRFFDVGIIPFRIYEVTISVSPVKMFEYMAQGIPVVTSAMPECKLYKSCLIAEDPADFVKQVDKALTMRDDAEYMAALKEESDANTWQAISGRIMNFIEEYGVPAERKEPVLSIAVPSYNMQDYLPELFMKLDHPALLKDIEVIIVNDGSKDDTLKVAQEYEKKYPGIVKVVDKENGGHGSCINSGVKNATGKYFKLVDADDYLEPMAFIKHLEFLKKNDVDMVVCDYCQFFTDGSIKSISYRDRLEEKFYTPEELREALHKDESMYSYIHMHAITYRTSLLKDNKITITEKSFYVDQEYISYPFPFVKSIAYQMIELYYYRLGRPGQSVDPAVIVKKLDMNYNILKNLMVHYSKFAGKENNTSSYLLNIAYHHSFFYLAYANDPEKFAEIMQWWKDNSEGAKYLKLLNWEFTDTLEGRDKRNRWIIWKQRHIPNWMRRVKRALIK